MIAKRFRYPLLLIKKMKPKSRKRIDCTAAIRHAIDPGDAITLRCNHSTSHLNDSGASPRPPAGPEKYTLPFSSGWFNQNVGLLSSTETSIVELQIFELSVSWNRLLGHV